MSGLPAIKYRKLVQIIKSLGYERVRIHGSHDRYYLKSHCGGDGHLTLVKLAGEIPAGTLRNILKDVSEHTGIPVSRLKEILREYGELMEMTQDTCSCCNGKLRQDKTDFVVNVRDEIVIIRNVPALVCDQCGEKFFSPDVSRKIDIVMDQFYSGTLKSHTISAREVDLPA